MMFVRNLGFAVFLACAMPPAVAEAVPAETFLGIFDRGSSQIDPSAVPNLKNIVQLHHSARPSFTIVDNCDASEKAPERLSLARANAIRAPLLGYGVSSAVRFVVKGAGASDPMVPTGPNVSEPQNRRVIIDVAN